MDPSWVFFRFFAEQHFGGPWFLFTTPGQRLGLTDLTNHNGTFAALGFVEDLDI